MKQGPEKILTLLTLAGPSHYITSVESQCRIYERLCRWVLFGIC